jgi:hypothetical protein
MTIRRVGPLSCAKIAAALYAVMGLVGGIFLSLAAMAGAFAADNGPGGILGAMFGVGAIVMLPIFYGCLGFVATLILASIYNALASAVGGIEVEIS